MYAHIGQWPLSDFYERVVVKTSPRLVAGSLRSIEATRTEIRKLDRFWQQGPGQSLAEPVLTLGRIDAALIDAARVYWLQQGNSVPTVNKLPRHILPILRLAIDDHDLPAPRKLKVKRLKEPKRKPKAWHPEEVARILEAAATYHRKGLPRILPVSGVRTSDVMLAILLFNLNTGVRLSAMMNTPTAALDWEHGVVTVPAAVQKQDADQSFELWGCTLAALQRIQPPAKGCLFDAWTWDRTNKWCQWRSLRRNLKWLLVQAGLFAHADEVPAKDLFHKFRRTFGTLVAARAGRSEAQRRLGHSHESVTELYLDEEQLSGPKLTDILPEPALKTPLRVIG